MQLQPNQLQISAGCGAHHRAEAMSEEQLKMTQSPLFLFLGRLGIWRELRKGWYVGLFVILFSRQRGIALNAISTGFEKVTSECRTVWIYFLRREKCFDVISGQWYSFFFKGFEIHNFETLVQMQSLSKIKTEK